MISSPPIVGVPFFVWCDDGPSSRISWPICECRRRLIRPGPSNSDSRSAVSVASAVRNVM